MTVKMAAVTTLSISVCTVVLFLCDVNCIQRQPFVRSFSVDYENNTFIKDGRHFRYISGSIHYSRVPRIYWRDRLMKMFAAGLDAIQVYVPWNVHQPEEAVYDFNGNNDLESFIKMAQQVGLLVLVRAGPYIDGEWEFGGFPAWILKHNPNTIFRTMDPVYIKYVDQWMATLLPKIKPLLYANGGPVIMVQIENEYGSYNSEHACDKTYMKHLRDTFISHLGSQEVLYTTDGCLDSNFKCGPVPGVFATTDFGVYHIPSFAFEPLRKYQPHGPLVNSEFYTGWLDHWGYRHETVNRELLALMLDRLLAYGANVNMYMFEGGTNFGYWNGADDNPFQPVPTSYDYDAPLTEAGDITQKYHTIRNVISKFKTLPSVPVPPSTSKANYGTVQMSFMTTLQDLLHKVSPTGPIKTQYPVTMEAVGQYFGFTLYRHVLKKNISEPQMLNVQDMRDRGYVMVDKEEGKREKMRKEEKRSVSQRSNKDHSMVDAKIPLGSLVNKFQVPLGVLIRDKVFSLPVKGMKGQWLDILVENQGHVCFNKGINNNSKGLLSNVTLGGEILQDWFVYPIKLELVSSAMDDITKINGFSLPRIKSSLMTPSIYIGHFTITSEPQDTYLDMSAWTKGQALISTNETQNLGRYWPAIGPQMRLYVPKSFLHQGLNSVIMLELETAPCQDQEKCVVHFVDQPLINGTTNHRHVRRYP